MATASVRAADRAFLRACTALEPTVWSGREALLTTLDDAGWTRMAQLAVDHGLVGMVARGLAWAQEREGITVPILNRLQDWHRTTLAQLMFRRNAARLAGKALAARNLRFIMYKGAVINEEVYGDLSLRAFSDCDILVPAEQFQSAYHVLRELGYSLAEHECIEDFLRPEGYAPALPNAASLKHASGTAVDLHWSLTGEELLPRDPDLIWRYCRPAQTVGALPGLRLSPVLTLINSATHLYAHGYGEIKPLVDFYVTAINWRERIDMSELRDVAGAMGVAPMVSLAAKLCEQMFAPHPAVQRLVAGRPIPRARLARAVLSGCAFAGSKARSVAHLRLSRLACCGTISSTARGVRIMLFPSARELAIRFRRPFRLSLYARYYAVQGYRVLTRSSNKTFSALR